MTPATIIAWHEEKLASLHAAGKALQTTVHETGPGKGREMARARLGAVGIMVACHQEAVEFIKGGAAPVGGDAGGMPE